MSEALLNIPRGLNVPYLDQWLGQWFIEPERGAALFGAMRQLNIGLHLQHCEHRQDAPPAAIPVDYVEPPRSFSAYGYRIIDGVALLELNGSLMKHEASATESTSTTMMRRSVRNLMTDSKAKAVIVQIDSPGGTVAGAYELAADIAALAKIKPVHAFGSNVMASAAYLMASQMTSISAAPSTLVGSLGTYGVVCDLSAMAAMEGAKVILLKGKINGKEPLMKGAGTPGTSISPEQLERLEEGVDDMNAQFYEAVLRGPRKPNASKVEQWFLDAGVWLAPKALAMGLIDRVESFDAMLSRVAHQNETGNAGNVPSTSDKPTEDNTSTRRRSESVQPAQAGPEGTRVSESNTGAAAPSQAGQTQEPPKTPANQQAGGTSAVAELKTFTAPAATAVEIDQACPGASSDFKLECLRTGQNLAQVKDGFIGWQAGQIRSRDEEIGKANTSLTTANAKISEQAAKIATLEAQVKAAGGLIPTAAAETRASSNAGDTVVDPKAQAKQEWDANANGCQQQFASEAAYIGYRKSQLGGRIKQSPRKTA